VRAETNVKVCAVVKADAYGHGAARIAQTAEKFADELAVADMREAAELLEAGVKSPVNILGPLAQNQGAAEETRRILKGFPNIYPTVCDLEDIKAIGRIPCARRAVNLKINTGMNRLGVKPSEVLTAARRIEDAGGSLKSVFSHLYNAADSKDAVSQLKRFRSCTEFLSVGVARHLAASSCMALPEAFRFDMVRPGLALYGYGGGTEPVLQIRAAVIKMLRIQKGEHLSYGEYLAPRDMVVAALGAGYADGLRRKSNPASEDRVVSVNGALCPVVGQICMDITLIDVTKAAVKRGDYAYVIGGGAQAGALAAAYQTNVYEILTGFKGRIKRNYKDLTE